MKHSLLVAAILAVTLSACGKKEEAAAAPAVQPAPVAAAPAPAPAPVDNAGTGLKADGIQAPAPLVAPQPEQK